MKVNPERYPSWLAFLAGGILYLSSSAPTITWVHESQDSGELAACAAILGIPHPTGYPLYMIVGWIAMQWLQWLDPGRVMVLLSVVCASVAAWVIARACGILVRLVWDRDTLPGNQPEWIGFLASIVCVINPVMWSQAVVCEVYALALMLQAIIWLYLVVYVQSRMNPEVDSEVSVLLIGAIALVLGLIAAHHLVGAMVILPMFLIFVLYRPDNWPKYIARFFILFMITGLLPYQYLPEMSIKDPAIDWGNPETFGNFIRHVGAFQYRENVFGVGWHDFTRRVTNPEWLGNWGTLFVLLAVAGIFVLVFSKRKSRLRPLAAPILIYIIWSVIFAFGYNASDYEVFTYTLIMPVALLIAVGAGWVIIMLRKTHQLLVWFFILITVMTIGISTAERWLEMDASDPIRNGAANFASREIQLLPENSLVITNSDGQLFSLLYGINVGIIDPISGDKVGPRPDIDALTPYWITTDWFYENCAGTDISIERWEPVGIEEYNRLLREFVDMNIENRPVFVDGYVLSMIQDQGREYRIEGGTALMRIIPAVSDHP